MLYRGKRSGIGIFGFDKGGFIVDGGKFTDAGKLPLISRYVFRKTENIASYAKDKTSHFFGDRENGAIAGLPKLNGKIIYTLS